MTAKTKLRRKRVTAYRLDGTVWRIAPCRHGELHGRHAYFYSDGSVRFAHYRNSKLHGLVTYYAPDGSVRRISNFRHGHRHGPQYFAW